ncbi:hypothetical protein GWI33_008757 [Rhynchophorus ferrugineus]|uniref:Uncharacterized protein n=1 Tax=Rhynchophorus ferrugineus TaxID=354439 RepID=A0A834MAU6_RHYFE|nr:hypothetical protein GWI33_008757 [Rhynchophorus ferrugineus]
MSVTQHHLKQTIPYHVIIKHTSHAHAERPRSAISPKMDNRRPFAVSRRRTESPTSRPGFGDPLTHWNSSSTDDARRRPLRGSHLTHQLTSESPPSRSSGVRGDILAHC